MEECQIIWVDLRYSKGESCVEDAMAAAYDIHIISRIEDIDQAIDIVLIPELVNFIQAHDPLICMTEQACFDEPFPILLDRTVGQPPGS